MFKRKIGCYVITAKFKSSKRIRMNPPKLTVLRRLVRSSEHMLLHKHPNIQEEKLQSHHRDYFKSTSSTSGAEPAFRHLQATALVGYEIRKICQSKAVSKVKQCHGVVTKFCSLEKDRTKVTL